MTLPILVSVPHVGHEVPPELEHLNLLLPDEIAADGDGGAAEIYDLESEVAAFVTTRIARAFVDVNRAEDDRRRDGVVKTHTCWDVPIYREPLPPQLIENVLARYYRPYHEQLTGLRRSARMGIDCHTMAAKGPPGAPDPGKERPMVCLSNADRACPMEWVRSLARLFEEKFQATVFINRPFKGGYIVRAHSRELPWIQIEISRTPVISNQAKREVVREVLKSWCRCSVEGGMR
jgi:N-formylglutamate deformylase